MSDFRLSCYRLFQEYSLVKYRTETTEGKYKLQILLIGCGSRMDTLLQEALINGQLLDTDLYITVMTTNPARSSKALLAKAPELKNYARIYHNMIELTSPDPSSIYATIDFQPFAKDREELSQSIKDISMRGYHYIIISTGNDSKNFDYASMASSAVDLGSLISYVQNKKPQSSINEAANIFAFGFQKDADYFEQLESIAYNLHYTYCKAMNDRASNEQIYSTFTETYNYTSNLSAAMHVQEKLECCGIDLSDPYSEANQFSVLMEENPLIINRLVALEHRRWMMEKILKGFVQAPSLDFIYSEPDITTHDSKNKWHTCLVPCSQLPRP